MAAPAFQPAAPLVARATRAPPPPPRCGRRGRGRAAMALGDGRRELELNWRYQDAANRRPVRCDVCAGSGRRECGWCHATGVLTLGDAVVCSVDGRTACLACQDGEVLCKKCKGHGVIAAWLV